MSFVNLMGNDRWSAADIKTRLHALIRSEVSQQLEEELNRALQGMSLGLHTLTAQEQADLQKFKLVTDSVAAEGAAARADAALLHTVLDFEQGLSSAPLTGPALDLWNLRHPV
jgi:hypothetical protein